ncbi:MAG: C4-dicarboxylate ABC transporter substrate-binding protein, partial [Rhodothalassiaceae bacterium]
MMRPRDIAAAALLPIVLTAAVLLLGRLGGAPVQTLDLSLPWGVQEFHTRNAARFAAVVAEATEGRVRITLHPGATLGIKGPESLRAARDGVVPIIDMAAFQQVGMEPILGLDALPFLVRDQGELRLLYEDLRPLVEAALARHGLRLLYVVPWPPQNLYARHPI